MKLVRSLQVLLLGAQIGFVSGVTDRQRPAQWIMADFTPTKEPPIKIARIDNQCPRDVAGVAAEFGVAAQMATIAANNFNPANRYVQAFWPNAPDETREKFLEPYWLARAQSFFACVARAATNIDAGNCGNIDPIHVTCVEDGDCATKNGYATLAHADHQTSTINLCNAFFDQPTSASIQCVDGNALKRYESKGRSPHTFMFCASGTSFIVEYLTNAVQQPEPLSTKLHI